MTPNREKRWRKHRAERRFRDCATCPEMVVVPAGSYEMGSLASEAGRSRAEGPVHRVTLAQSFAVGVYEVTRGEFGRFVESTGYSMGNACETLERDEWKKRSGRHWRNPGFKQTDRHPVTCVNWEDAQAYVQWLSQEDRTGVPAVERGGVGIRGPGRITEPGIPLRREFCPGDGGLV